MITRQTSTYPTVDGGLYTLPQRNEDYRLFSVSTQMVIVATSAQAAPVLYVRDGAGNAILTVRGLRLVPLNAGTIQWVAGGFDLAALLESSAAVAFPPQSQLLWLPTDLWIKPQWSVFVAPTSWSTGDVFGPLQVVTDQYGQQKNVAPRAILPQDSSP